MQARIALLIGIALSPGCYTMLKHPVPDPADEGFTSSDAYSLSLYEGGNCVACHGADPFPDPPRCEPPWLPYYETPWWERLAQHSEGAGLVNDRPLPPPVLRHNPPTGMGGIPIAPMPMPPIKTGYDPAPAPAPPSATPPADAPHTAPGGRGSTPAASPPAPPAPKKAGAAQSVPSDRPRPKP